MCSLIPPPNQGYDCIKGSAVEVCQINFRVVKLDLYFPKFRKMGADLTEMYKILPGLSERFMDDVAPG